MVPQWGVPQVSSMTFHKKGQSLPCGIFLMQRMFSRFDQCFFLADEGFAELVGVGWVDLEDRVVEVGGSDVAELGGIGLDVAGVEEAVEDVEGVVLVDAGFKENLGSEGAGGVIEGADDGELAPAKFHDLHLTGIAMQFSCRKSLD